MARINPVQIQEYLRGLDYPLSKKELVQHAQEEGADENVIQTLLQLPMERFNSPSDVSEALGRVA